MKKFDEFKESISENLRYHIENGLDVISENIFRYGSEEYLNLIQEAKELSKKQDKEEKDEIYWNKENPIFKNSTKWCLENLETGKKAILRDGTEVVLDLPKKGGNKKYIVYRNSGKQKNGKILAFKIEFGDPNLSIKNDDTSRAKSFWARHNCELKKDPNKAGFWSCYGPTLFTKNLELVSNKPW